MEGFNELIDEWQDFILRAAQADLTEISLTPVIARAQDPDDRMKPPPEGDTFEE